MGMHQERISAKARTALIWLEEEGKKEGRVTWRRSLKPYSKFKHAGQISVIRTTEFNKPEFFSAYFF